MIFSSKAEYGVRLMVELGRQTPEQPPSLKAIADAEGLPLAYLEQVVARLRKAGLVMSARGAHGGYWLARPAGEISMDEVVQALEGAIAPMECFVHDHTERVLCSHEPDSGRGCATKLLWMRVHDGITRSLHTTTLADLVEVSLRHDREQLIGAACERQGGYPAEGFPAVGRGRDAAHKRSEGVLEPVPERGLLRRREKADGDPPARASAAGDGDPRRDRLRSRYRRAENRGQRRQRRGRSGHGRADHHPLPADSAFGPAEQRARHVPRPDRQGRRAGAGGRARGQGLRLDRRRARGGCVSTALAPDALADIESEFPVLRRTFGGHPLTYLDSSATSQTPQPVIEAMNRYYTESRASVHRGVYPLAVEATDLYEGARRRIADWLHSTPEVTIFTANVTAAINLVAYTWGRQNVQRGDLVVLTEMEHHSNIVPWQILCQDREAELAYVPVMDDGQLDLDALELLLERGPKLVSVVHVSNVLGTINPVSDIVRRAHDAGALVPIDGTQAVPQMPVDLKAIDA